jgi:Calcium-dependent channel, 7TM region, putative phosphate
LVGQKFANFVNGYLPVVALLTLILILPVIFENLALKFEHRKTFSDVQASMLTRYFYYQLANVYISATAGSLLQSLSDIIDRPYNMFETLGTLLPRMAGYFVALLVTKILAGLPMIFLRFGALSRMLLLKTLSNEKRLTQRELDAVYRLENVQYGWEFPTQLLVVVIVFTYAVICPLMLPVGCCYFMGALLVYKKQVLYVYSPVYESGGAMFPIAVQRTLFGLVCGQLTFIGYLIIESCHYQPIFLFPLPLLTIYCMSYFSKTYAEPGKRLSLERAREHDRMTAMFAGRASGDGGDGAGAASVPVGVVDLGGTCAGGGASAMKSASSTSPFQPQRDAGVESRRRNFDRSAYRQPVLTELAAEPWTYRRGVDDPETLAVRNQLRQVNRYTSMQLRQSSMTQASASSQSRADLMSP